jgi:EAL domain-containing protein (putative c-di-GMP-specific phosphodiesterase class I)
MKNTSRIERLELFDEFEEWYMMQVCGPLEKYCTAHCFVKLSVFLH